jgi:hypothetical protein
VREEIVITIWEPCANTIEVESMRAFGSASSVSRSVNKLRTLHCLSDTRCAGR